jgi:hypothetical protein
VATVEITYACIETKLSCSVQHSASHRPGNYFLTNIFTYSLSSFAITLYISKHEKSNAGEIQFQTRASQQYLSNAVCSWYGAGRTRHSQIDRHLQSALSVTACSFPQACARSFTERFVCSSQERTVHFERYVPELPSTVRGNVKQFWLKILQLI